MKTNCLLFFLLPALFTNSGCGEDDVPITLDEAFLIVDVNGITFEADTDEAAWTINQDNTDSDRIDETISSIRYETGSDVSGTFSGVLADEDGNLITLTNGRFSVPIQ